MLFIIAQVIGTVLPGIMMFVISGVAPNGMEEMQGVTNIVMASGTALPGMGMFVKTGTAQTGQ